MVGETENLLPPFRFPFPPFSSLPFSLHIFIASLPFFPFSFLGHGKVGPAEPEPRRGQAARRARRLSYQTPLLQSRSGRAGGTGLGGTWPRGQACISRTRSPVWGGHAAKLPPGKRIQCGGVTSSHVPTRDDWSSTCVPPLSHWKSRVAGGRTPSSGSPMASRSRAPCGSGTPTEGTNRDADRFAVLFFKP